MGNPCLSAVQLLEERDAELERVDAVMTGLREAAATREAALQEARHTLGCREAALRDKEARWAMLSAAGEAPPPQQQPCVLLPCHRHMPHAHPCLPQGGSPGGATEAPGGAV